jgi:hypothetical protein
MQILKDLANSKKFWAMTAGLVFLCVASYLAMSSENIALGIALIGSYIVGQGVADSGKSPSGN